MILQDLTVLLRWLWLCVLVFLAFAVFQAGLMASGRTIRAVPWWVPLLIAAVLAAASWLGERWGG